jgi:hypothetical protein
MTAVCSENAEYRERFVFAVHELVSAERNLNVAQSFSSEEYVRLEQAHLEWCRMLERLDKTST